MVYCFLTDKSPLGVLLAILQLIMKNTIKIVFIFLSGFFCQRTFAQDITFYKDIAPIIHQNCTPCHRSGGPAPFSLISYEDVAKRADFISYVTKTKYMPPWHAEKDFGVFKNERRLTALEIETIQAWVKGGIPQGNKKDLAKNIDEYDFVKEIIEPDLQLSMDKPFTIPGNNTEEYRFFNISTNLKQDQYITSIEFIPGNKKLVHHSRVMADTSNLMKPLEGMSELNPDLEKFKSIPLADQFLYGWVPGNIKIYFPPGTGKKIYKDTDLILNVHYAPSPVVEEDRSRVNLYFAKEPVSREVRTLALTEDNISNLPFILPANKISQFFMRSPIIGRDISLISILPHMHLLGQSFRAYAITKEQEVIKLIDIRKWDFNWQQTYQYKNMVKIPAGSVIYAEAVYDNSENNLSNPFNPPRDITYGWNTTDEMMNLIMYYLDYKEGDEDLEY